MFSMNAQEKSGRPDHVVSATILATDCINLSGRYNYYIRNINITCPIILSRACVDKHWKACV